MFFYYKKSHDLTSKQTQEFQYNNINDFSSATNRVHCRNRQLFWNSVCDLYLLTRNAKQTNHVRKPAYQNLTSIKTDSRNTVLYCHSMTLRNSRYVSCTLTAFTKQKLSDDNTLDYSQGFIVEYAYICKVPLILNYDSVTYGNMKIIHFLKNFNYNF